MSQQKMNFVFFFPDEMRADSLGCYGHPVVQTPNFDQFAEKAVRFDQCHVQNTVCTPSRSSVMTGLYPHVSGHRTLWHLLRPHEPSLFRYLKEEGYQIKWFGKNDLYSEDYLKEILGEEAYQDLDEMKRETFTKHNPFSEDDPRYYSFLMEPDVSKSSLTETDVNIQKAIQFLESDEAKEKPFMIFLPTFAPHAPYVVPEPFYSMYEQETLPELLPAGTPNKPSYHELIRIYRRLDELTDDTLKRIQSVYLGMISHVDTVFGQLMDVLKGHGFTENTSVIVASDHGDYAGDYGLVEKWPNAMEDCLTRVPLMIQTPSCQSGHVVLEQVELFDIMATVLDLAGIEARHDHFARSLVPQLRGEAGDPNRAVFAEGGYDLRELHCFEGHSSNRAAFSANDIMKLYLPKANQQQEHPKSVCRTTMMRTMDYKLIRRTSDVSELYDLKKDPSELHNVYEAPQYSGVRQQLESRMLDWYVQTSDVVPRMKDSRHFLSAIDREK
ncbi:sulfatase-like hydrolase/transferase [Ammoniphilus sp. YIM 78166]|uniref:sulfatase-like hydrolase/transferase n=1 Tax=Ammoniphilus sp. YIM 78166 TaxID=1644106 RepID=UPI00106F22F2|nr:sulfatase-like hydrolase/transferase [Ammoniphilus sp. YIM 78166]